MPRLKNHFAPNPRWPRGRHKHVCDLTLEEQPALRDLISAYQEPLAEVSIVKDIPTRWLHLSMLGIAFVDEVDAQGLHQLKTELAQRLSQISPPTVTFHEPKIVTTAVYLRADPTDALDDLLLAMHDAAAAALPRTTFQQNRPEPGSFNPHVSLAYVIRGADNDVKVRTALRRVQPDPVTVTFHTASLLTFHRDNDMWEWRAATRLPLG